MTIKTNPWSELLPGIISTVGCPLLYFAFFTKSEFGFALWIGMLVGLYMIVNSFLLFFRNEKIEISNDEISFLQRDKPFFSIAKKDLTEKNWIFVPQEGFSPSVSAGMSALKRIFQREIFPNADPKRRDGHFFKKYVASNLSS